MNHGSDNTNVKGIIHVERSVFEELLSPFVVGLAAAVGIVGTGGRARVGHLLVDLVVLSESGLQLRHIDITLLAERLHSIVFLHEATADVMLNVPNNLLASLSVEAKTERPIILPHATSDVIAATELVGETVTVLVDQNTADTTKSLGGEELDLGVRLLGLDETGRMDLDPLHVDKLASDLLGHADAVTGAMNTVGGWEVHQVVAILLDVAFIGEISAETARGEDDGTGFAVAFLGLEVDPFDTEHVVVRVGDQLIAAGVVD